MNNDFVTNDFVTITETICDNAKLSKCGNVVTLYLDNVHSGTLMGKVIPEKYRPNNRATGFIRLTNGNTHMFGNIFLETDGKIKGSYMSSYGTASSDLSTDSESHIWGSVSWVI